MNTPDADQAARQSLRKAIEGRTACEGRLGTAEAALQRAEGMARKARARGAQIDADAKQAAILTAKGIPAAAPAPGTRVAAAAELDAALGAVAQLEQEQAAAKADRNRAHQDVLRRAVDVINVRAEQLGAELISLNERSSEIRNELLGLQHLSPGFVHLGRTNWPCGLMMVNAISWKEPLRAGHDPEADNIRLYLSYRERLAKDAAATFDAETNVNALPKSAAVGR